MSNLLKRSIFGTLFLAVTVGCLLCPCGYAALMSFVTVVSSIELLRMLVPGARYQREKVLVIVACTASFILSFCCFAFGMAPQFILLAFLPLLFASILLLFDCASDYDFPAGIFYPALYVALPICCSLFLAFPGGQFTGNLILGLFILIWCSDVGAYCFGMMLGQRSGSRKLFPALSPKKSWAGAIGGAVCALLAAFAVAYLFDTPVSPVHWVVIALLVSTVGVFGDLFESLLKRHAGIKDSGNIIPGHGGMLDRYDDILFLFPTIVAYLKILNII